MRPQNVTGEESQPATQTEGAHRKETDGFDNVLGDAPQAGGQNFPFAAALADYPKSAESHPHSGHVSKGKNPPKAYENMDFLHGPYGRPIRVLSELIEPQQRMKRFRVRNTVVFFGSARILSAKSAREELKKAEDADAALQSAESGRKLEKAKRALELSAYYEAARQLAGDVTRWSKTLPRAIPPFFICSGGGPGIMEAANRGASEAGGITLGLGISLPYEQVNNPYVTQGLSFEFHYFFIRKYWLMTLARALVVFPGGFGTLDEMCELLTLVQTRKIAPVPILLFGESYWREVINFDSLAKWGVIDEEDLHLFHIVNTVEEARKILFDSLKRYCQPNFELAGEQNPSALPPHALRDPLACSQPNGGE
ncbi:MAG: TIGR00730 family Rossman fold protein [Puniceicoccales bacterium]|jgi:uncharacterized protein (TIGR00730 family)|nr:TIGR00730 family Rossman fold protein [Puniceicoccales bacterium]